MPLPVLGLIDSGGPLGSLTDGCRFVLRRDGVATLPPVADQLGHGSAVEAVIRRAVPDITIRHAQVFADRPATAPMQVAAALDWLIADGVRLVCLSLGLSNDRSVLRDAVARAIDQGAILVASVPAQGEPVYPASYPGVVGATGDARCGFDDLSFLPSASGSVFGAWCASPEQTGGRAGGASIGCGRLAAHLAARWCRDDPIAALANDVTHRGRELKRVPA